MYKDFERISSKIQREEDWDAYFTDFQEVECADLLEVLETQSINYSKTDYFKFRDKGDYYEFY